MPESKKTKRAAHIVAGILSYDARVKSYIAMLTKAGWSVDVICYRKTGLMLNLPFAEIAL